MRGTRRVYGSFVTIVDWRVGLALVLVIPSIEALYVLVLNSAALGVRFAS